ncbi:MAG: TetR family transcriptional regulator [Herpetosiphonaceae bacterium]|nr:MAG: TetR family transcriptional regulator [Herpetosiphonaceae bacterium]
MGEHEQNRRREIIEAALRVFSRHGFHKATIKQIADEAGLKSPALIYWYFKNKHDLFQVVISESSPLIGMVNRRSDLSDLLDRLPEEVLPLIAQSYYKSFDSPNTVRMFRLLISEAARDPEMGNVFAEAGMFKVLHFVVAYLQRQIELGRLQPHDPQVGARSFLGMLMAYILSREVIPHLRAGLPEVERYVEQAVAIFLDGLRA